MLATKQGDKAWKANAVAAIAASSTLALQSGQEASYMVLFNRDSMLNVGLNGSFKSIQLLTSFTCGFKRCAAVRV